MAEKQAVCIERLLDVCVVQVLRDLGWMWILEMDIRCRERNKHPEPTSSPQERELARYRNRLRQLQQEHSFARQTITDQQVSELPLDRSRRCVCSSCVSRGPAIVFERACVHVLRVLVHLPLCIACVQLLLSGRHERGM